MKILLFFLLFVAHACAEPFTHEKTGIVLPDTLAGLTRGEAKSYGVSPGEEGVMIPYRTDEVEITVYIRQIDPTKDVSAAAIVQDSLAAIKQLETMGRYSDVKVYQSAGSAEKSTWAKAAFTARMEGNPLMSFIYARIKGSYAIKARASAWNTKSDLVQPFILQFQKLVDEAKP